MILAVASTACGKSVPPALLPTSAVASLGIKPSNIKRIGRELPSDYEVSGVSGATAPAAIWGLGAHWTADPAPCATLADPAGGHGESAQGLSGSGAGGIVYAVVADHARRPDPAVVAACSRWTMTNGRTRSVIRLFDAPEIDGSQTLGMTSEMTTSAEGGTRIEFRAQTFTAYLGDYYAFTTLITDPGSPHRPLAAQFAADLLVKTVSALRG